MRLRTSVLKSDQRSLSVTVRARRPSRRRSPPTLSAWRRSERRSVATSSTSSPNVTSRETDFARRLPDRTGVASTPRARSCSNAPARPKRRSSQGRSSAAASPTVRMPSACNRSASFGPTSGNSRSGSGARKAASPPTGTSISPSGFAWSEPTFAVLRVPAMHAETAIPSSRRTRERISSAAARAAPPPPAPVRSTYASSMPADSTNGESVRSISWKACEAAR